MEIQSFNSKTHFSEIGLNYIFPLCTRCANITMLFAISCYYCGSPEFWIPLRNETFFDIRNERESEKNNAYNKGLRESGIWVCATGLEDSNNSIPTEYYNMGYASAVSYLLVIPMFGLTWIYMKLVFLKK